MNKKISLEEFELIFHSLFLHSENTQLINGKAAGFAEPLYRPAKHAMPAQIIYANGFLQSALHEVAHWCYAGPKRRQQLDYGYWYVGDVRDQVQQQAFEQVELVPQAYEYLLSQACGLEFQVSLDNFNPDVTLNREEFMRAVKAYALDAVQVNLLKPQLSPRLALLLQRLR